MMDRLNTMLTGIWLRAQDGVRRDEGQAVAEYALILALVAVAAVAALKLLGGNVSTKLNNVASTVTAP